MSRIIPLDEIPGHMPRVGKLSAGYMDVKTTNGRTVTFPVKSRTLVFRCSVPEVLHAAQKIVGGTVSKSPNPRAEGLWRLISQAIELEVLIATDDRRDTPVRYEAWGAYGKIRDCDGRRCRFAVDPKSGEREENIPCWCAARGLAAEDPEACRITTRLNLLVPAFMAIPGIGVWQLESRGRTTFQDLKGLRELFQRMRLPGAMGAPVTLRVEIVRGRNPRSGEPWEFPVFRFRSRLSLNDTLARTRAFAGTVDPATLPPPDDSTPPLGAGLTAEEENLSTAASVVDPRAKPGGEAVDGKQGPEAAIRSPADAASRSTAEPSAGGANGPAAPPDDDEPLELTPEKKDALAKLISRAALADGSRGKGYVRAWLQRHYRIAVSDVADIPREIRARVRAHALRVLNRREEEAARRTPASMTLLPAPNPSPPPAAAGHPASPNQLKELRAAFADLDYVPQQIAEMIRRYRPDLAQPRLEDLTSAQAHALLDGLRAAGLRAS